MTDVVVAALLAGVLAVLCMILAALWFLARSAPPVVPGVLEEAVARADEALHAAGEVQRNVYRCQGVDGCENLPTTVRFVTPGESLRLCAPCAANPSLVPGERSR